MAEDAAAHTDLLALFRSACARVRRGEDPCFMTFPAPDAAPERLFDLLPARSSFLWAPRRGRALVGIDVAREIDVTDDELMAAQRDELTPFLARLEIRSLDAALPALTPCAFGGLPFDAREADPESRRSAFADRAWFVVPRFSFAAADHGTGARLGYLAEPDRLRKTDGIERDAARLASIMDVLARPPGASAPGEGSPPGGTCAPRSLLPDSAGWDAAVREALGAIAAGPLVKVVLTRAASFRPARRHGIGSLLRDIGAADPAATRFAFRRGEVTFFGATPERLVALSGLDVATEAVAATASRDAGDAALLTGAKERHEHRIVVRDICERLKPLASHVMADPLRILELPRLVHLLTPIRARLDTPHHVLDIVLRLHPTPAVCGTPRKEARELIRRLEPTARGWYAGPCGWFDADGNGEFVVAIRSATADGREIRMRAGAGIVAGSCAAAERVEIDRKLAALGRPLGLIA